MACMNFAGCIAGQSASSWLTSSSLRSGLHDGAGKRSGAKLQVVDLIEIEILFVGVRAPVIVFIPCQKFAIIGPTDEDAELRPRWPWRSGRETSGTAVCGERSLTVAARIGAVRVRKRYPAVEW